MKRLLVALLIAAVVVPSYSLASRKGAPFQPHDDKRFDEVEDRAVLLEAADTALLGDSAEGAAIAKKYVKAVYDVAVDLGTSVAHDLGVSVPAGAVFTNAYIYVNTAFTDSGTGSLALECGNGLKNIMEYIDPTIWTVRDMFSLIPASNNFGSGSMISNQGLAPTNVANNVGSVQNACAVRAVVRGNAGDTTLTTGKLTVILEYFNLN